jgi:hypothetical protein
MADLSPITPAEPAPPEESYIRSWISVCRIGITKINKVCKSRSAAWLLLAVFWGSYIYWFWQWRWHGNAPHPGTAIALLGTGAAVMALVEIDGILKFLAIIALVAFLRMEIKSINKEYADNETRHNVEVTKQQAQLDKILKENREGLNGILSDQQSKFGETMREFHSTETQQQATHSLLVESESYNKTELAKIQAGSLSPGAGNLRTRLLTLSQEMLAFIGWRDAVLPELYNQLPAGANRWPTFKTWQESNNVGFRNQYESRVRDIVTEAKQLHISDDKLDSELNLLSLVEQGDNWRLYPIPIQEMAGRLSQLAAQVPDGSKH